MGNEKVVTVIVRNSEGDVKQRSDIAITFPLYRKEKYKGRDYERVLYEKWEVDGRECTIEKLIDRGEYPDTEYDVTLSRWESPHITSSLDHLLGQGKHKCSETEFNEALDGFLLALNECKNKEGN
jgi:hypothetical protein